MGQPLWAAEGGKGLWRIEVVHGVSFGEILARAKFDASGSNGLMLMNLDAGQLIATVVTGAAGGGGLSTLLTWLARRQRSQAYTMGAVDHAVQTAMSAVTAALERTEARLGLVEAQHGDCQTKLTLVHQRLDASERERAAIKAELDRVLSTRLQTVT
ncbi:MAG TPA: hypothetical protein PLV04_01415 [Phenylobacterium sp.]|uniref:Uncharacterized protein n=1 Tax=Phenylobacterium conjunctum TaxID=1298959 RepID=A0ABW3T3D8_9CAUL|nr:hypothetical protein [Phenylobacterium sp.]HQN50189.1 hypothetical protein [Phenylobacterium sp.]